LDPGLVLVILIGNSALGVFIRPLLSEQEPGGDRICPAVVAMLMTFAALVLGLLTTSVKSSFDKAGNDLRGLAVQVGFSRSQASRCATHWHI
jgi:hypothetical protein